MPSHGPFPCASYLQVPVDHPHLVAVQDSLQDLLDAVAAEERGESSRRCLERHIFLSCTRRAAFPPLALLPSASVPISTVCHTLVVTQVPVVTQPGAAGHPSRVLGCCVHPWAPPEVTPGSWGPAGRTPHVPNFSLQTGAERPMRTSAPFPRPRVRLVARAVSVRLVSRPLNPGSAACVRKEGEKDEAMITSVPNQLSARQKAFIYMYFILFV